MHDPVLVDAPVLFPGRCAGCGTHKGPMVDTCVDFDQGTRLYVCVNVCLDRWAQLAGFATAEQKQKLQDALTEAVAETERVRGRAEQDTADQVGLAEAIAQRAAQVALEKHKPPAARKAA